MKKGETRDISVRPILVFNPFKRLIAIFSSMTAAAKVFGTSAASVMYACTGKLVSCQQMYFRALDDAIEVTQEDLHELKLEEYDKMCGVKRKFYKTSDMSHTGKLVTPRKPRKKRQ